MNSAESFASKQPTLILNPLSEEARTLGREQEVIQALEPKILVRANQFLQDPNRAWQVSNILPDLEQITGASGSKDDPVEKFRLLQSMAAQHSPQFLIVRAGNGTTEGGLTMYARTLERIPSAQTESGRPKTGLQVWGSGWDSEENKHNYGMDRWFLLSGMIDMRAYDRIRQKFIKAGFDPGIGLSVFKGLAYTSFQEPATEISHRNTALMGLAEGDKIVYELDWAIRGDENRHGRFYKLTFGDVFSLDPEDATIVVARMLRAGVTMPAALMHDEDQPIPLDKSRSELFDNYAAVTQATGIYTAVHYYGIAESLIRDWGILNLSLSGKAAQDQEYLGKKFTKENGLKTDEKMMNRIKRKTDPIKFPWLEEPIRIDQLQRPDIAA